MIHDQVSDVMKGTTEPFTLKCEFVIHVDLVTHCTSLSRRFEGVDGNVSKGAGDQTSCVCWEGH